LNLAIRLLILLPVLWIWPPVWGPGLWMFPVGLVLLIALGSGLGLLLMPFGVLYQDVEKLLTFGVPLWMIVTPIIYPLDMTSGMAAWHWWNPPAGLLVTARDGLILGATEPVAMAIAYGLVAIPLLLVGLLIYRLSIPVLIERVPS
jgi:lipopolysaccharide transport system permease protein